MARVADVPCAGCGKLLWSSATSLPAGQRRCQPCRATQWEHGTSNAYKNRGCRCGLCSEWNRATHLDYARRRAAGVYEYRQCTEDECERDATGARGLCRMHYRRWARAAGLGRSPSDAWSESRRSSYHARRARMNGQTRNTKVFVSALVERDGTDCSACGQPIGFDLAWPDPRSVSVDHTWPISRGGAHALDNTTLMCLRCNLRKGNRVNIDDKPTTTTTPGAHPQGA